jgi:hypothetical protein
LICLFGPQLAWHNLAVPHELLWDASLGSDDGRGRTVRELVAKALRGPLAPAQQQQLFADLDAEPKLIYRCGLVPKRLPVSDITVCECSQDLGSGQGQVAGN